MISLFSKLRRDLETTGAGAPPPGALVLLCACDTAYLDYAVRLVLSAEAFSPGGHVALHIVNPTDAARARLARLQSRLRHTRLWVSYESVKLPDFSPEQRRAYYTCARFLRVAELLRDWQTDFLVLDADALVVGPLEGPFSDDPAAQVSLLRRDLSEQDVPDHLAVAAGTVWLRNVPAVRDFASSLAAQLRAVLEKGEAAWFMDQRILASMVRDPQAAVKVGNIDRRYVDWTFADESVIWQAKGERKRHDVRFVLLSQLLSDDDRVASNALPVARMLLDRREKGPADALLGRVAHLLQHAGSRVVILLPRMDLPWKKPANDKVPPLADDVLDLRLHWVRFVTLLANACETQGTHVEIVQVPAWEIDRRLAESFGASAVLVPHRCSHDFEDGPTPVLFYMQEYFRWMFVVDPQGWSAAATVYPVSAERRAEPVEAGAYAHYRARLASGNMPSKFAQPDSRASGATAAPEVPGTRLERLRASLAQVAGSGPRPKIFFPLQIRHDQSIRYFCDHAFDDVLDAVIRWGKRRGVEVHLKPHPANPKLMQEYLARYPETPWLRWRDENVHDLIAECDAVFVVNSGVGFEALLHAKPVVMFGRAEYDCVAIRAKPDDIDAAWAACQAATADLLEREYGQFFDWFTTKYAVDMSRDDACKRRLNELAGEIAAIARVRPWTATAA